MFFCSRAKSNFFDCIYVYSRILLGETSSAFGGGAPGLSDRFVDTFLWLDKLGISARLGVSVIIRQTLLEKHYSLIDSLLEPAPVNEKKSFLIVIWIDLI